MAKPLVLVVGATGTVGAPLVEQLVATGKVRVRALTRDPNKTRHFSPTVEVVTGDLERPESLPAACAGIDKAFVLSNGSAIQYEHHAIRAAVDAGAKHIVKLSGRHLEADFLSGIEMVAWHARGEQAVRSAGVAWTVLRPQTFASIPVAFLDRKQSAVVAPVGDGKDHFVDPRDIAAVATHVLTTPGHDGIVYELTGSEWLSFAQVANKLSRAAARPISFVDVPVAAWIEGLVAVGVPAPAVKMLSAYMTGIKHGKVYAPTGTIQALLGRPPRNFDEWARDHASAFST
jgi:uncharacterized protein YbjT (DUF2867 family)